jgi:hypothetical protein
VDADGGTTMPFVPSSPMTIVLFAATPLLRTTVPDG